MTQNSAQAMQYYQNVFPINSFRDGTSSPTYDISDIITKIFENKGFEMGIKNMVETQILATLLSDSIKFRTEVIDNPFDAIYLADLKPDSINQENINDIQMFSGIEDRSDTVQFNDGWDD